MGVILLERQKAGVGAAEGKLKPSVSSKPMYAEEPVFNNNKVQKGNRTGTELKRGSKAQSEGGRQKQHH